MLYCYLITRAGPEIEKHWDRTAGGAALRWLRCQELAAAVRELPAGTRFTPQLLLEWNAALSAAAQLASVLPMRLGASFRDEQAVLQLMAGRRQEMLAALERLDGKAEMILRAGLPSQAGAEDTAARINGLCRPLESWSQIKSCPGGETVLELAHLIPRTEAAGYRQRLQSQAVEITGPWPPFHFLPQFLRLPVKAARSSVRRASRAAAG